MSEYVDSLPVRIVNGYTGTYLNINSDGSINLTTLNTNRLFWDTDIDWNKGILGTDVEVSGTGASAIIRPNSEFVPDPSIYANWHLNESSGTTLLDSSVNNRDAVFTAGSGGFVSGKLNNAITFSGDGIIDGGDIANFEYTQPFSLECWVSFTNDGYPRALMGRIDHSTTTNPGYFLFLDDGYPTLYIISDSDIGARIVVAGDTRVGNASWHHLVCTYDGSGLGSGVKFYIDGILQTNNLYEDALNAGSILNTANFYIGSYDIIEWFYFGEIDEIVIYNEELNQTQIDFRYNSGSGTEIPLGANNFKTTAHYETNIVDSKIAGQLWGEFNFIRTTPSGTTVIVKCRASDDINNMGSYGSSLVPGVSIGLNGQFIQFSVDFTGTTTTRSLVDYISALYSAPTVIDIEP